MENVNEYLQDAKSSHALHLNLKIMLRKAWQNNFPYKIYSTEPQSHPLPNYVLQDAVQRASSQVKGYLSKL